LKNDGKILSFIENFRSYQAFFMVIIAWILLGHWC
jgi:hypothetical protein